MADGRTLASMASVFTAWRHCRSAGARVADDDAWKRAVRTLDRMSDGVMMGGPRAAGWVVGGNRDIIARTDQGVNRFLGISRDFLGRISH